MQCRISWTQIEVRLSLLDHLFIVSIHQDRFHCRSLDVDWLVLTQSLCFLFCCSSVMLFILLFQLWNMLSQQWNNKSCCDWAIGLPVILYLLVPRRFYRWMLMLSYQNDTDLPDDLSSLAQCCYSDYYWVWTVSTCWSFTLLSCSMFSGWKSVLLHWLQSFSKALTEVSFFLVYIIHGHLSCHEFSNP